MGDKTKIDWADASWNPVTGCLHDCEYCYARKIANRFGGRIAADDDSFHSIHPMTGGCSLSVVEEQQYRMTNDGDVAVAPYPFGFTPTFHRYRLDIPARWTKPRNIFVCSMADLFGVWVPEEWILEVMEACVKAPQHRYMFLTKNLD